MVYGTCPPTRATWVLFSLPQYVCPTFSLRLILFAHSPVVLGLFQGEQVVQKGGSGGEGRRGGTEETRVMFCHARIHVDVRMNGAV